MRARLRLLRLRLLRLPLSGALLRPVLVLGRVPGAWAACGRAAALGLAWPGLAWPGRRALPPTGALLCQRALPPTTPSPTPITAHPTPTRAGHPSGLFGVGYSYLVGRGVAADHARAARYLRRAVEANPHSWSGQADACYFLGETTGVEATPPSPGVGEQNERAAYRI